MTYNPFNLTQGMIAILDEDIGGRCVVLIHSIAPQGLLATVELIAFDGLRPDQIDHKTWVVLTGRLSVMPVKEPEVIL